VPFSKRIFTIKQDVDTTRTLKTQEITFMYKETFIRKRLNKKIYVIFYNKNKLLFMPFATKQNKKIKIQGSLETLRRLTKQDTLLAPPTIG